MKSRKTKSKQHTQPKQKIRRRSSRKTCPRRIKKEAVFGGIRDDTPVIACDKDKYLRHINVWASLDEDEVMLILIQYFPKVEIINVRFWEWCGMELFWERNQTRNIMPFSPPQAPYDYEPEDKSKTLDDFFDAFETDDSVIPKVNFRIIRKVLQLKTLIQDVTLYGVGRDKWVSAEWSKDDIYKMEVLLQNKKLFRHFTYECAFISQPNTFQLFEKAQTILNGFTYNNHMDLVSSLFICVKKAPKWFEQHKFYWEIEECQKKQILESEKEDEISRLVRDHGKHVASKIARDLYGS